MQIQDVKRWHWAATALVVGLAFSFAWSNYPWDQQYPTLAPAEFERGLTIPTGRLGHIADIQVLPPIDNKYEIFCTQVRQLPRGGGIARPVAVLTNIPYNSSRTKQSYPDILAFLKSEQASHPEIHYGFAWYRQTWAIYVLCITASLVLIGGIWPSVVSLMTGGGLGFSRPPKEPGYDLDRFATGEKSEAPRAAPEITNQDLDEVRRLDEELERNLTGSAPPRHPLHPLEPRKFRINPSESWTAAPSRPPRASRKNWKESTAANTTPSSNPSTKKASIRPKLPGIRSVGADRTSARRILQRRSEISLMPRQDSFCLFRRYPPSLHHDRHLHMPVGPFEQVDRLRAFELCHRRHDSHAAIP